MAHPPECDGDLYYCECGFGPTGIEDLAPNAHHQCYRPPRPFVMINILAVSMPGEVYEEFAGLSVSGYLVIDRDGELTALTPCCAAFVTFCDSRLSCKSCYGEADFEHLMPAQVAVPAALINRCIPGTPRRQKKGS
ncbi:hypothetical protein [Nocardia sp. NPDC050435]|uniref:hypothetical protein n=1 Tax=Nocardia sp. NPDC050435 TaxID=3155040 RepID=UPI0033F6AB3D